MCNILVVDDCEDILTIVDYILVKDGHKVFKASNSYDGLTIFKNKNIDLVILDLYLNETTGAKVLKEIRSKKSEIPAILISGLTVKKEEYTKMGFNGFVEKPFFIDTIKKEVQIYAGSKNVGKKAV